MLEFYIKHLEDFYSVSGLRLKTTPHPPQWILRRAESSVIERTCPALPRFSAQRDESSHPGSTPAFPLWTQHLMLKMGMLQWVELHPCTLGHNPCFLPAHSVMKTSQILPSGSTMLQTLWTCKHFGLVSPNRFLHSLHILYLLAIKEIYWEKDMCNLHILTRG